MVVGWGVEGWEVGCGGRDKGSRRDLRCECVDGDQMNYQRPMVGMDITQDRD
jgi:hypothetical protein